MSKANYKSNPRNFNLILMYFNQLKLLKANRIDEST